MRSDENCCTPTAIDARIIARQRAHLFDQLLPAEVARMRLAAVDDLQLPRRQQRLDARLVAKEQRRALVRGGAAREADDQLVLVERDAGAARDLADELALAAGA